MKEKLKDKKKVAALIAAVVILAAGLIIWAVFADGAKDSPQQDDTQTDAPAEETPKEELPDETVEEPAQPEEPFQDSGGYTGPSYLAGTVHDVQIPQEAEEVIVEYFDVYYNSLKNLKEQDLTYLFKDPDGSEALLNQYAISLMIQTRAMKPNDLKLSNVSYDLEFSGISGSGSKITVTVLEDNRQNFAFMKDIQSKVYNIQNTFTLEMVDGQYKISDFNKVQDFYVMFTDVYNNGGEQELKSIKNNYLNLISQKLSADRADYNRFLQSSGYPQKECDHLYDRQKALSQTVWVNRRDPGWPEFTGNNCQNFASQVLYAGGIPMDYHGSAASHLQWKCYGTSQNNSETPSGLAYTWTYVPYFYTYARDNTGYGLCADVDVNLYYAQAGDVIHVGSTAPTRHALVVVGDYKVNGKTVDILVNSNTVDLENYPMSAYSYPYSRLIKIYGWND